MKSDRMSSARVTDSEKQQVKDKCQSGTVGSALLLAICRAGGTYEGCATALGIVDQRLSLYYQAIASTKGKTKEASVLLALYESLRKWGNP